MLDMRFETEVSEWFLLKTSLMKSIFFISTHYCHNSIFPGQNLKSHI